MVKQTCFTGQEIVEIRNGKEYVVCAKCGDENDTVSTNGTAWFDRTVIFGASKGAYVHIHCLSEERRKEITSEQKGNA